MKVKMSTLITVAALLMSTGAIVPLYFYTDLYMVDSNLKGFYSNPLGYKYFMYSHY